MAAGGVLHGADTRLVLTASHRMQTKLRLIEIYNARLTERERRRQFILDRGLLNIKSQQVSATSASEPHHGRYHAWLAGTERIG